MNRKVWRADDSSFANISPPGGFQCRCVITTLSEEELRDEGLQVITSIPAGFAMTPGFGASSFVRS
jgi:hypothetical protein